MADINEELVNRIYQEVLHTVNRALHNARKYKIEILQQENPSYSEIAKGLKKACDLMDLFADDIAAGGGNDGEAVHTVSKAREYTYCVSKIAEAINANDEEALENWCKELERRPFV